MKLKAKFYKHTLNFRFDAGTSRGVLKNKDSYFIKIFKVDTPSFFGIGESGPLYGLSIDFQTAENKCIEVVNHINSGKLGFEELNQLELIEFPSVKFAIETALRDLKSNGKRLIFENDFYIKAQPIKINGLVWMNTKEHMLSQIKNKIEMGFDTIKLKIGAIDFEEEMSLMKWIRNEYAENVISIRVDANGAFNPEDALEKLKVLSDYKIHSIEQPIKQNQTNEMALLCENSPVPIALDEELIPNATNKKELLNKIKPAYIILKPSLLGGFSGTAEWINAAENLNIGWWITSALESNIGLNAICQFTAEFENNLPQGLGTGQLYDNNIKSPLEILSGEIKYNKNINWNLSLLQD